MLILSLLSISLAGCIPVLLAVGAGAGLMSQPQNQGQGHTAAKEKLTLHLESASITPSQVSRGQEITVTVTYKIAGTFGAPVTVKESKTLVHNGVTIKTLSNDAIERKEGIWENSLTFAVPFSAEEGRYTIEQKMMLESEVISSMEAFQIVHR